MWPWDVQRICPLYLKETNNCLPTDVEASLSYLPTPPARAGYDSRSIFKQSLTGLNSEFSFSLTSCLTNAEEPSLSYYLPIAGGRIIGFIPFPCPFPMMITITPWAPHFFFLDFFTHPSAWAGYDTRSIFKRSLTGLNSEFSFS